MAPWREPVRIPRRQGVAVAFGPGCAAQGASEGGAGCVTSSHILSESSWCTFWADETAELQGSVWLRDVKVSEQKHLSGYG